MSYIKSPQKRTPQERKEYLAWRSYMEQKFGVKFPKV